MSNSLIKKDTAFDRLQAYYLHQKPLSDKEKMHADRLEQAFAILCHNRSRKVAVTKYLFSRQAAGFKMNITQAYRDMNEAEMLFAPLHKYSREFLRLTIIESALSDIKRCEKIMNDPKTPLSLIPKMMEAKDKAEKRIRDAGGVNESDRDIPDFSQLEPHQYTIDLPQPMIEMFMKMMANGSVNLDDMMPFDEAEILDSDEFTD